MAENNETKSKILSIIEHLALDAGVFDKEADELIKLVEKLDSERLKYKNLIMNDDELQDHIAKISDKVIIPNWYFKYHLEEFMTKKYTDKEFKDIVLELQERGYGHNLADDLRGWVQEIEYDEAIDNMVNNNAKENENNN